MKTSKFNAYLPLYTEEDTSLLFNSLSKAVIFIDDELKELLVNNKLELLDQSFRETLYKNGIIVDDDIQEELIFNAIHNKVKYNRNTSSFLVLPTFRCNNRCYYCYEGAGDIFTRIMDDETLERVILFIQKQTLENKSQRLIIGLYGGEPLLFPEKGIAILSHIRSWAQTNEIEFYSTITSNATLMTEEVINNLILPFINSIHFTFDGPKNVHDNIRQKKNGEGTFDNIIFAIRLLKNHFEKHLTYRIHFGHTDNPDKELARIDELLETLEAEGLKERPNSHMYFVQIEPKDACLKSSVEKEYIERKVQGMKLLTKIWDLAISKGWNEKLNITAGAEHSLIQYNTIPCEYLQAGKYVIDPDGDVYMCPTSAGHTEHRVGKILHGGYLELNEKYYQILTRNPTTLSPCKNCNYLTICAGSCPITVYDATKSYTKAWCGTTKDNITNSLITHFQHRFKEQSLSIGDDKNQ